MELRQALRVENPSPKNRGVRGLGNPNLTP